LHHAAGHHAPGFAARVQAALDRRIGWVMVAPALVVLVGLVAYPLAFNLYVSLHRVSLLNIRGAVWPFVGLLNFERVLTDPFNHAALLRTAVFAAASVVLQLALGLAGALAFNVRFRGKAALLALCLVPMMVTPVVVGIAWRMLLNYDWGVVNWLIGMVGIAARPWLADNTLSMVAIIVVQVWWGVSFVMLVLLGGLTALPREPFEAAAIDGASDLQVFRYVTAPLLAPVLIVCATIRTIDALREFDLIYTLTGGGPGGSTRVFALELFYTAYERGDFGMSAAQAILLVMLIMVFTVRLVRSLARPDAARAT
jgi:multiple sugar transport system permease protein